MTPSTHDNSLTHLKCQLIRYHDDLDFMTALEQYTYDLVTLTELSLDPLRDDLAALYFAPPARARRTTRAPCCAPGC